MSQMTLAELATAAAQFAGLDTEQVFSDLAAGRFVSGYAIMAAISQVSGTHPHLADKLAVFKKQVSGFHTFWT